MDQIRGLTVRAVPGAEQVETVPQEREVEERREWSACLSEPRDEAPHKIGDLIGVIKVRLM